MKKTAELRLQRPIYSPAQVAELAGVHPATILNYIHAGKLYAVRLERTYRIPARAVLKLLVPERVRPPRLLKRRDEHVDIEAFDREMRREHVRRGQ